MTSKLRDQRYPEHARTATSYMLVPGARNVSRAGTLREARWPAILKFDGHPDGVALAKREAGVSKRHLHLLERSGLLRSDTSVADGGRQSSQVAEIAVAPEADDSQYPEGAVSFRLHRQLERDGSLPNRAKQKRLQEVGALACDACDFDFGMTYGDVGIGFIEAHHTVPVGEMRGTRKTKLTEMVLVCSNCHRMLHRGDHLMTVLELRSLIGKL